MRMIVRRDPVEREMTAWRNAMDRLVNEAFETAGVWSQPHLYSLPLDVIETSEGFVVKASLPGAQPENFEITLTDNVLTIKAETSTTQEVEDAQYHIRERRHGKFERSITLPTPVKSESITADYVDGVLTLNVPKAEEVKPKKIAVSIKPS
jgi:HSP20 family protein